MSRKSSIVLCYHNGALGNVAVALMESCTYQGRQNMPNFIKNKNLHHYKQKTKLVEIQHPNCDVLKEKNKGKTVLTSTSMSNFGRYLIVLMGLNKWTGKLPRYSDKSVYKQSGHSYQNQLETLAITLHDKVKDDSDWYADADVTIDILDYWKNPKQICRAISKCNLTPITPLVKLFCQRTAYTNKVYHDTITKCSNIVEMCFSNSHVPIDINFLETAVCYAMLLDKIGVHHTQVPRLSAHPTNTGDLINLLD